MSGSRLVYWSWDSFFASLGSLRLQDNEIVKKNLDFYLRLQRADGAIPKRVAHPLYWMKFIGVPIRETKDRQRPTFFNSYFTAESIAQNPILIIAFEEYIRATNDLKFLDEHYNKLHGIFTYLKSREKKAGLLHEGMGGGWAESVLKRGAISFTNMCYARSLWAMAELAKTHGAFEDEKHYGEEFKRLKTTINHQLWSDSEGGYYSDWLGHLRHHHFATDGNLLAIWWDLASPAQAVLIQKKIDSLSLEDDVPIKLAYDSYSFWRIYIFNRIGGVKDYHVGFSWTWLGCVDVLVKLKMGKPELATVILEKIATKIVEDGTVHETYNNGKVVSTLFYKGEHPWAWGAGMFLYACSEAGYHLAAN